MRPPIVIFNGCGSRIWTYDLLVMSQVSCRTALFRVVAGVGVEPTTFSLWGWRATTALPRNGDPKENRTPAFAVKGRRLKPLDYGARYQDPLPQVLSFYCDILALLSANNFVLSTTYGFFIVPPRPALSARAGIEPTNDFCHRTTQHLSLGSEHTYFSNTLIIMG